MSAPAGESNALGLARCDRGRLVALVAGLYALAGGAITLTGWAANLPRLSGWHKNISMFPNTAICAALSGLALVLLSRRNRPSPLARSRSLLVPGLGVAVSTIGGLTLFQHLSGIDLGIDRLLFDRPWGQTAAASPMRMGLPAATSFTGIGAAIVLLSSQRRSARRIASVLSLVFMGMTLLSLVGYLYGAESLYALPRYTGIALQTASMIFAIALGLTALAHDHGLSELLHRPDAGGVLARRLLVPIILICILIGWAYVTGRRQGLFDTFFGAALRTLIEILLFILLLWWTAAGLSRGEKALRSSRAELSNELIERRRIEAELRRRERTQRLLAEISAGGAGAERGPQAVVENTCACIADELGSHRCGLVHVDLEHDQLIVEHESHGHWSPLKGRAYSISDYTGTRDGRPQLSQTIALADLTTDPRTADRYEQLFRPLGVRACIVHPLLRDGRWTAAFWVSSADPREWTDSEVELVKAIAERLWTVLEQSRVSAALRESETLLRGALEDANRAGRLKDEFLATLSHELRTPMTAILGWSQVLQSQIAAGGDGDSGELVQGLKVIERNARLQSKIIEDLLDMSRIIAGKIRLDVQSVQLADVFRAALEVIRPSASAKGVRLESIFDDGSAQVHGDPARLQQVVFNLLSNAVKFTPKGGKVQLVCQRVNSQVEFSVSDTGIGIRPEFLPHVFERFRQQDAATTRRFGGLGLGLAIVKQLVELHGGDVQVASEGEGKGATFTVRLPLAIALPRTAASDRSDGALKGRSAADHAAPTEINLDGIRVLVVDDEPDARELVRRLLESHHAKVELAGSAEEGLRVMTDRPPHVLLSDIGMPGEDGYSFITRVRDLPPNRGGHVPAIALTAFARADDRTRAMQSGFDMHLSKPIDQRELVASIFAAARRK